jgi:AraC family transcriptional regulator
MLSQLSIIIVETIYKSTHMKKTILLSILFLCAAFLHAQENKESVPPEIQVEVKNVPEIQILYYEFTGPYNQSFSKFSGLMDYIKNNNIPLGEHALGIFYDDPNEVPAEQLKSEAGFMVTKEVNPANGYLFKKIPAGKAVIAHYKSYDQIMAAYGAIEKYISDNGITTAPYSIEIYYNSDPSVVDAEIRMMILE